jgi:hypothetical protein
LLNKKKEIMKENKLLTYCCSDEENRYRVELIAELIHMYEHPEDSNDEWKKAIIGVAREKGYGNDKPNFSESLEKINGFTVGGKIRITKRLCGHEFKIGDVVILVEKMRDCWLCRDIYDNYWNINEEEGVPVNNN